MRNAFASDHRSVIAVERRRQGFMKFVPWIFSHGIFFGVTGVAHFLCDNVDFKMIEFVAEMYFALTRGCVQARDEKQCQ